jgi:hypothetical protein
MKARILFSRLPLAQPRSTSGGAAKKLPRLSGAVLLGRDSHQTRVCAARRTMTILLRFGAIR